MNKFLPILVIGIVLFLTLFFRGGWIEPDSYAFYNRSCGVSEFETPILSEKILNSIPCDETTWFFVQSIIWIITLFLIAKYLEKKGLPFHAVFYIGFSLSIIYSLLAIEDDYLVTLFFFIFSHWLLEKNSTKRMIAYAGFVLVSGLFLWKGSFLIGGIILGTSIHPLLGFLGVLSYILYNGLSSWGGATEGIVFNGWPVLLPLIIWLFYAEHGKVKKFISEKKIVFYSFVFLSFLGFYQAKWGLYSGLFLPVLFWETLQEKFQKGILLVGFFALFFSLIGIGLTKPPNDSHWMVLEDSLEIERGGETIFVDNGFGFEKWGYEYIGGRPILGPSSFFPHYRLTTVSLSCEIVSKADNLTLYYCEE